MASSDNERERRRGSTCWLISCIEPFETVCFSVGAGADRWSLLGASSAMAGSVDIIFLLAVWGGEQESTGPCHTLNLSCSDRCDEDGSQASHTCIWVQLRVGVVCDDCQAKPDPSRAQQKRDWQIGVLLPHKSFNYKCELAVQCAKAVRVPLLARASCGSAGVERHSCKNQSTIRAAPRRHDQTGRISPPRKASGRPPWTTAAWTTVLIVVGHKTKQSELTTSRGMWPAACCCGTWREASDQAKKLCTDDARLRTTATTIKDGVASGSEGRLGVGLIGSGRQANRSDRWGGSPLDDALRHRHHAGLRNCGAARLGAGVDYGAQIIAAAAAGDVRAVKTVEINQSSRRRVDGVEVDAKFLHRSRLTR